MKKVKNINQGVELLKSELERKNFDVQIIKARRARFVLAKNSSIKLRIRIRTCVRPKQGGGNGELCIAWTIKKDFQAGFIALVDLSSKRIWLMDKNELHENSQQCRNNNYGIYMYLEHSVDIRNKKERNFVDDFNEWILNKKIENLINNKKLNRELINISLEDLEESLKRKNDIGKIGEEIAYKYEISRLEQLEVKNPKKFVDKYYENNVNAGYDIYSNPPKSETRYIEVKSTTKNDSKFFITKNEIEVLKKNKENAFIYFVIVKNVKNKSGEVIKELPNPINIFESKNLLKPILFTGIYKE